MTPPPEFCLLWIPHWATCLTKTEWASWVQAGAAILAVFVALRAVRLAHRLSWSAKLEEERRKISEEVAAEKKLLAGLLRELTDGRMYVFTNNTYEGISFLEAKIRSRVMHITVKDYSKFPADVAPYFRDAQKIAARAWRAMERMASDHEKKIPIEKPSPEFMRACAELEQLVSTMDQNAKPVQPSPSMSESTGQTKPRVPGGERFIQRLKQAVSTIADTVKQYLKGGPG